MSEALAVQLGELGLYVELASLLGIISMPYLQIGYLN